MGSRQSLSDPKEACFGTVSGKHVENIRRGAVGSVIDGQPDSALLRFKVRENFAVPGAISSQSRIEPEEVMCRPWDRAEPSTHRQDPDDGRQTAGYDEVSRFHSCRNLQTDQSRVSIRRHNRVCVPASSKLSRRVLEMTDSTELARRIMHRHELVNRPNSRPKEPHPKLGVEVKRRAVLIASMIRTAGASG